MLDARTLWRQVEQRLKQHHAASPENAQYARDLAVCYDRLGDLAVAAGDAAGARKYFEDLLAIARAALGGLARERPVRPRPRGLLRQAGRAGRGRRRRRGSPEVFRGWPGDRTAALGGLARERQATPATSSVCYNRLGKLAVAAGDAAGARKYFEDALAIAQRLSAASPENAKLRPRPRDQLRQAGRPGRGRRRRRRGARYYEDSLAIRQRLSAASPENAQYARGLSVSYEKLGELARSPATRRRPGSISRMAWRSRAALGGLARERPVRPRPLGVFLKIANLLEKTGDQGGPAWWRLAWETLAGMKRRGMHVSPEDERFLKILKERFGFGR